MLRFTGSLLFVSSLAVQAVMAFPLHPTPAANIQVSPLIPSPTEHALIVVYDYTENGIQGIVKATNIQVMRFGNTFQIDATRGVLASDADRGLPEAGLASHFFSDDPAECDAVHERWPTQWIEESRAVFGAVNPNLEPGGQPLYRLYNNRPDANHRYTVSTQIRDEMLAKGWILEGRYYAGADTYAMCIPN